MKSLRQPKQITMTGHNEKQYRFLVKGGEDLRLDQRIEQVRRTYACSSLQANIPCLFVYSLLR